MENKKYYLEFVIHKTFNNYDMQSKWFDTEEEALKWLNDSFDYTSMQVEVWLMSAEWLGDLTTYGDIKQERRVM